MNDPTDSSSSKIVWVLGGSSRLGQQISSDLSRNYSIVSIGRSPVASERSSDSSYVLDLLLDDNDLSQGLAQVIHNHWPVGVVFCQRYRPTSVGDPYDLMDAIKVEVESPLRIIEDIFRANRSGTRLSVVVVSSVNYRYINNTIDPRYHIVKAAQIQMARYLADVPRTFKANVNCIAVGSFLKYDIESYAEKERYFFDALQSSTSTRRHTELSDISAAVRFLISPEAGQINGQVITIDGGLSNVLQETLLS